MSFLDEHKFCNRVIHKFCYDVELIFCSFLSKFTYSKNLKTGTIHLNAFHYIDTTALQENTPLAKFIRNYIRDSSGVFSISSLVKISMISMISSLSLKLYLNSFVYDRNIFGSSLKVFGNLGKFRKMFGNIRMAFGSILNLRKFSESGWKSSENCQKRPHSVCLYNKENILC